jgi:hypothetical protein
LTTNNGIPIDLWALIFANCAIFTWYERGLVNKGKIAVQELGGQRGEGVYFRDNIIVYNSPIMVHL